MLKIALAAATVFVATLSVTAQEPQHAPFLKFEDIQNHIIDLKEYQGKVLLLNFWATWCGPCRTEVPELVKLQREYGPSGLQVIGINYPPEKADELREFAKEFKVNYPLAIGTGDIASAFDSGGGELPTTVVIDREGTVREHILGRLKPDTFVTKIKPLLAMSLKSAK